MVIGQLFVDVYIVDWDNLNEWSPSSPFTVMFIHATETILVHVSLFLVCYFLTIRCYFLLFSNTLTTPDDHLGTIFVRAIDLALMATFSIYDCGHFLTGR